jgi:hypothetical protein
MGGIAIRMGLIVAIPMQLQRMLLWLAPQKSTPLPIRIMVICWGVLKTPSVIIGKFAGRYSAGTHRK